MKLGYTLAPGRGATNTLLSQLADHMQAQGKRLCGTVQIDTERSKDHLCDMDVRVLPDGPTIRISQDLGAGASGCRLNPEALEQAVALTQAQLEQGADLLIVNKFGKHEAEGRGFRDTIATALEHDIPVIVGANKLNLEALREFTGGQIDALPAELEALTTWVAA